MRSLWFRSEVCCLFEVVFYSHCGTGISGSSYVTNTLTGVKDSSCHSVAAVAVRILRPSAGVFLDYMIRSVRVRGLGRSRLS